MPLDRVVRDQIRSACRRIAGQLDKSHPLSKDEMERVTRGALQELGQPEGYVGWTMVALASEFWREQVAAVPPARRLLLLPHCLRPADGCPAEYSEFGLDCGPCGACSIADFRTTAERLGYRVIVAEGSPVVMKILVGGYVDAILGVACLNVLEKAIDKILLAGIPCMAVPLLSNDCKCTSVDMDWVDEMIRVRRSQPVRQTTTYMHLLRAAARLFEPDELDRLAVRQRGGPRLSELNGQGLAGLEPIAATEAIAHDFLAQGGKYARPFITLAVYDALTGGGATASNGAAHVAGLPDAVKRTAMSIETFHKASLVHDDIEDDDSFRYGRETLHRKYGIPTALNVGDYLIGMGYRLVSREAKFLGAEAVVEILDCLARAHTRLSEGQGAELVWRDARDKRLRPIDALAIYALKTSPAFEAALYCGARLAGPVDDYGEPLRQFARHLGVAFQILNDLNDWHGDSYNKLLAGSDALGGRPTVLWALALEGLARGEQEELLDLVNEDRQPVAERLERTRQLYQQAGVFEKAYALVDKYQERAAAFADTVAPAELRRLLHYLIETVLEHSAGPVALAEPAMCIELSGAVPTLT
ncbi:MAG: polyprenyl synthetase family protein [Pirellulaceae bacterium]|nr:polyprenyl synthetase family protein [Pirellulaceae bacterium]